MRVQTEEWRRFIPGVRIYKGKKTLFDNGEKLNYRNGHPNVYNDKERNSWEVIIVLPGVKVIPTSNFHGCKNIKTVIMSDTVKRIEDYAFYFCFCLAFVKLSRNLEYLGEYSFSCCSLTSIYIPPSCRKIGQYAFLECEGLIILQVPQQTFVSKWIISRSRLMDRSPFELELQYERIVRKVYYKQESTFLRTVWPKSVTNAEVHDWIKSINGQEGYALHRECASCEPSLDRIIEILKSRGIQSFYSENKIGVTPSTYLKENPFHEINEQRIINAYIFDLMGETLKHSRRDSHIIVEGTNTDLLHIESVETNTGANTDLLHIEKTNRITQSLDEQMSRQARWKSNFMFLCIKNQRGKIVKVLKTSLNEEKTLDDVLKDSIGDSNSLRIDDEVFDWAAIKTVQVFDLPTLCGDKKRFTLKLTFTEDR